jgi:hypothetical protein
MNKISDDLYLAIIFLTYLVAGLGWIYFVVPHNPGLMVFALGAGFPIVFLEMAIMQLLTSRREN